MPSRRYIGGFVFLLFFCWKKVWAKYSKIIHLPFFPLFEGNSLSAWWNWWRNLFLTHKHTDTNLPPFFKRTFCCFEGLVFFGLSYPTCDISLDARVVRHRFTATVHLFCNHFFILEFFPNKKLSTIVVHWDPLKENICVELSPIRDNSWPNFIPPKHWRSPFQPVFHHTHPKKGTLSQNCGSKLIHPALRWVFAQPKPDDVRNCEVRGISGLNGIYVGILAVQPLVFRDWKNDLINQEFLLRKHMELSNREKSTTKRHLYHLCLLTSKMIIGLPKKTKSLQYGSHFCVWVSDPKKNGPSSQL